MYALIQVGFAASDRGAARHFGPYEKISHWASPTQATPTLYNCCNHTPSEPSRPFKALNNSTFAGLQLPCSPLFTVRCLLTVSCENITLCRHACNILHKVEFTIWCKSDTLCKKCVKGHLLQSKCNFNGKILEWKIILTLLNNLNIH